MQEPLTEQQIRVAALSIPAGGAGKTPQLSEDEIRKVALSISPSAEEKAKKAPFLEQVGAGLVRTPEVVGRAFERGTDLLPSIFGLPAKIAVSLAKMGVKPIDPVAKATEPFVGTIGEGLGEMIGSLAIPMGRLGAIGGGAALGLTGALGQAQAPTTGQLAGGGLIGGGLGTLGKALEPVAGRLAKSGAALAEKAEKSKFAEGISSTFRQYMARLRSELGPQDAKSEIEKVLNQREQAKDFTNNLSGGLSESAQPERLRSAVTDLDKKISSDSAKKYDDAYEAAEKGGQFGVIFPTASKNAKELLQEEDELRNRGVPQADMDKITGILSGLVKGGERREAGRITAFKAQTFESGTETMKRLKELAQKYSLEKNRTVSSRLGGLANDVKTDLENSLKSSDALEKWQNANKHWETNALPLRTPGIQNAVRGSAEIGNLDKELLNFDNLGLPHVLNQLGENGKKALAFQSFKDSMEFNPVTEKRQTNPSKLLDIFDKKFAGQNKPFLQSLVGNEGLTDLSNMQKNQLAGVNDKIENLSKSLSQGENAKKIERLPQKERNLILFNHLKKGLDLNKDLNIKQFIKLSDQIHPQVKAALFGEDKDSRSIFNTIEGFSRMENVRAKAAKAEKLDAPTSREFVRKLADLSQGLGVGTALFHPALGAGLGLASLVARALQGRVPAEKLTPIVENIVRKLSGGAQLAGRAFPIVAARPSRERG